MRLLPSFSRPLADRLRRASAASDPDPVRQDALFDEATLARVRRLVLLSGRAKAEGLAGEHRSRRRGASPEFADFKSYSQGDDFRRIDWSTYARLDGLFVRLSEVTTELSVHLLIDASESMDWTSDEATFTKFSYARRVAGALAYVALWHFDRLTIAPFGAALGHPFGPVQGRSHIVPMLRFLEGMEPLGQTTLAETVERYARARRRPGLLILLSDLLAGEPDDLRAALRGLRARGWQVVVVQTLDEAEVAPDPAARYLAGDAGREQVPVELIEAETGERLKLTPDDEMLGRYARVVVAWLDDVEAAAKDEEAIFLRLLTRWDFDDVVLALLHRQGVVA